MKIRRYIPLLAAAAMLCSCGKAEDKPAETSERGTITKAEKLTAESGDAEKSAEAVVIVGGRDGAVVVTSEGEYAVPVSGEPAIPAGGDADGTAGSVTGITLTFYDVTLRVGETRMPLVTMYPEDAPDKSEIWESSDISVASVDGKGNITAISEGNCTVTVRSAANPSVSAAVDVTVKPAPDGVTYIDGILIANKTYALPADYNPGVDPNAQAAFDKMQAAAAGEGLNIFISSGFRSYEYQAGLYERYVERSGKAEADRYSARPGHSEHQTGLAFDLNSIDISFADTKEYVWLKANCAEYGFIIRYTEEGEATTGYMYEPWHIRYLGVETAKKVTESGLTLEEYLGITSKYDE